MRQSFVCRFVFALWVGIFAFAAPASFAGCDDEILQPLPLIHTFDTGFASLSRVHSVNSQITLVGGTKVSGDRRAQHQALFDLSNPLEPKFGMSTDTSPLGGAGGIQMFGDGDNLVVVVPRFEHQRWQWVVASNSPKSQRAPVLLQAPFSPNGIPSPVEWDYTGYYMALSNLSVMRRETLQAMGENGLGSHYPGGPYLYSLDRDRWAELPTDSKNALEYDEKTQSNGGRSLIWDNWTFSRTRPWVAALESGAGYLGSTYLGRIALWNINEAFRVSGQVNIKSLLSDVPLKEINPATMAIDDKNEMLVVGGLHYSSYCTWSLPELKRVSCTDVKLPLTESHASAITKLKVAADGQLYGFVEGNFFARTADGPTSGRNFRFLIRFIASENTQTTGRYTVRLSPLADDATDYAVDADSKKLYVSRNNGLVDIYELP